jgi:hypothetical protein
MLPLAGGLVRVLGTVVEVPMLAVLYTRQHLAFRSTVALQFIGADHTGHIVQTLEQFPEEFLRRLLVPAALHAHIEDVALLIDGPPEVVPFTMDRQQHFIEVPCVPGPRAPTTQLIGVLLAELAAPLPDGFLGHEDAPDEEQLFHVPIAEAEAVVQPDAVTDDLGGKAVVLVTLSVGLEGSCLAAYP